jgi:mono/diheme cytochrome c family protein
MQRYADIGRRQQLAAVLTAVAATVAGCGNGSTGQLSLRALGKGAGSEPPSGGAPSGMTGTSSTTGGAGSDGGSGSTLNPTDAGTGAPAEAGPGSVQGRAVFETILPDLSSTCGGACHAQGAGGAPLWLGPPDPYISAVSFPGIVVANPGASIVITKGRHEGPALQDPLLTQVTQWLTVEAAALPVVTLPQTPPFAVTMGANNIDCSAAGVAGTHITFDAAVTGNDITLSNLNLVAPAATGVHIVYPIFAVLPQGAPEIDDQSFSNEDQTVGAGETAPLGPGLLILTDWSAGAQMKIEFTTLAAATVVDSGTLAGGCKALSTFTANAVPAIQANTCLTCHNSGGSGNAAMDLSGLAATPPDDATACAQALAQVNLTTPAQSNIILAPTGGLTNHPFTKASQSFVTMMETWIAAEQ